MQSGFRAGHGCTSATVKVLNDILTAIDRKQYCAAVFIDLAKAFDSVNHHILIGRLDSLGFSNDCLAWFTNYFSDRVQCVKSRIGFLFRYKASFTHAAKHTLVKLTILSILDLGDVIYKIASNTLLNKLDAVYHNAIRFVTKAPYTTHHCDLYALVGWPSLHTRRQTHWLQVIYKTLLGKVPPYLSSLVTIAAPTCSSRSSRYISLVTPKTNSSFGRLSFQFSAANDWNQLQKSLKLETLISLTIFRHQLSEQLTDYCTCTWPIYNLAQTTTYFPTVFIYIFCSFAPHYFYLYLAHSSTANQAFQHFTCYIVFTSPPWPFFALISPHFLTLYIDLYFYCIIDCMFVLLHVSLCCCMCRTALLYTFVKSPQWHRLLKVNNICQNHPFKACGENTSLYYEIVYNGPTPQHFFKNHKFSKF
jgi:hypothetical protein